MSSNKNITLTCRQDIASEFNRYFVDVALKLNNEVFGLNQTNFSDKCYLNETLFLNPASTYEVAKIVSGLQNKSSTDIFGLSNFIVKQIFPNIVDVFTHILNLSFSTGTVPDKLKIAVVIPLFKTGDKLLKENYRPISLLPIFSKVLEKVMKSRIMSFLNKFDFFNVCQFGFRENKSTEGALTYFLNQIYMSLNNDENVAGIFIDIKKAFDMVNHTTLLSKLHNAGFRGISFNWFKSYLENRQQCVKIGDIGSGLSEIKIGVPQGSVLGPILFLIYINSVFELPLSGKMVAFADDMALAYNHLNKFQMINNINSDLKLLSQWFSDHRMILSEKTRAMIFKIGDNPNYENSSLTYHFNCSSLDKNCTQHCVNIEYVKEFKYLGITLDANLNWKKHVNNVAIYLNSLLRKFYILRNLCPMYILKNVYYALVQSKIEYGLVCFGGIYESIIKRMIKIQKHIVKVMFFKSRVSSSWPIFSKNKILPVRSLYCYKVLKLFYCNSGNRGFKLNERYNCRSNLMNLYTIPKIKK